MSHFDKVIAGVVLGLGLAVACLSIASARLGPTVDTMQTAQSLDGALVNTQIVLSFTEPMSIRSVERSFAITPRVPGDFSWSGNELLFIPRRNLRFATRYTVTVGAGSQSAGGAHLARTFRQSFTTQSEHLLYLGTSGAERGRLVLASVNGDRSVVGASDGLITDYSVSFDRSLAVYVKRGSDGERADQLWLLSLADGSTQRVFARSDWDITQPHFSPDGRYVVFLASNVLLCQKYYGCFRDLRPQIELLDLSNHRVFPFRSRTDVPITNFIDFSPAGQIAYTDLGSALTLAQPNGQGLIHIPNENNSLEFVGFDTPGDKAAFVGQTPYSTGGDILVYLRGKYLDVSRGIYDSSTPAFAGSGTRIAYAAYRGEQGIEPVYGINAYDFRSGRTLKLTSERGTSDWDPQWSSDDRYIAFVRSQPQEAMYMGSGEIWVMRADSRDAHPLGAIGRDIQWVT